MVSEAKNLKNWRDAKIVSDNETNEPYRNGPHARLVSEYVTDRNL